MSPKGVGTPAYRGYTKEQIEQYEAQFGPPKQEKRKQPKKPPKTKPPKKK